MQSWTAATTALLVALAPGVAARQAAPTAQTTGQGQAAGQAAQPQPRVTFRVESNYIEVDAVVTDDKGNIVRNLTKDDFQVLEDGHPQKVDTFTFVDIPVEHADRPLYRATPVEPDVVSNAQPMEGRVYLLVLDAYHVEAGLTAQTRKMAKQFLDQNFGANDLGAVVLIGNAKASQEFTHSRRLLENAVDKFIGQKVPSAAISILQDTRAKTVSGVPNELPVGDQNEPARAANAREMLSAVGRLAQYMAGVRGRRKALLLFNEGLEFNTNDVIGPDLRTATPALHPESDDAATILDAERDMIGAATRANVSIYSVDPRGLPSAVDVTDPGDYSNPITMDVQQEIARAQSTLREFADRTGGLAYTNTQNYTGAFQHIVQDNSEYYVLGYYAGQVKPDGKFHTISVKVSQPGLHVRARKGYYAPNAAAAPTTPPDVLHNLLTSPMPMGGLPMRMSAAIMKGDGGKDRVCLTVEITGSAVPLDTSKKDVFANTVELSYAAFNDVAHPTLTGSKTLNLTLTPDGRKALTDHGLRLTTQFELPPGRYQLRLAGREHLGDRAGSVFKDLAAPDFTAAPLAMSDLLLTSTSASAWATTEDAASLKGVLPGPVTAERDFSLDDSLAVFADVYDNDLAHPHKVELSATVRADDGTQAFTTHDERDSAEIGTTRTGAYGYLARIPLDDLVPGTYILTVTAQSRLGGPAVTKEIQFKVH
jgi:VWFA-related protein